MDDALGFENTSAEAADAESGYILFAPQESNYTYLIDRQGQVVHTWKSQYTAGLSAQLLDNGHLLRAGKVTNDHMIHGTGGVLEEYDWDGKLVWQYYYSDERAFQHHDFTVLPNGDILFIATDVKTKAQALAAGRNPSEIKDGVLVSDSLIEIQKEGLHGAKVVWQWNVWDHIIQDRDKTKANYGDVAAHPELIDLNYIGRTMYPDGWTHINAVDYNPATDQVLVSSRNFSEVWVIDHGTTTAQAAGHSGGQHGHGGDLLYRYGNPQAYRAGDASDRTLFGQHDAKWIKPGLPGAGDILVYDNGVDRPAGNYSTVLEITPPMTESGSYLKLAGQPYGPSEPTWTYTSPSYYDLFSSKMSGAQRLPNGDTLITVGDTAKIFEVSPLGDTVWSYQADLDTLEGASKRSDASIFYATWYPDDYPAFSGRNMTPEDTMAGAFSRYVATNPLIQYRLGQASSPAGSSLLAAAG